MALYVDEPARLGVRATLRVDTPHGHAGGWAADIGNYQQSNYTQTTNFMIWLNKNQRRLIIRQIIGANQKWVYPHYYPQSTVDDHKNHVHIGWGTWS